MIEVTLAMHGTLRRFLPEGRASQRLAMPLQDTQLQAKHSNNEF